MAKSPRKSSSPRTPAPAPVGDLFDAPAAPAPPTAPAAPEEQWHLEEAPASPHPSVLPKAAPLRAAPIAAPESTSFESNRSRPSSAPREEEPIPQASPHRPATPAPSPAAAPTPSTPAAASDPFEIDDDLPPVAPSPLHARREPDPEPAPSISSESEPEAPVESEGDLPASPARTPWNPVGLLVALGLLAVVLSVFFSILYTNRPTGGPVAARTAPTVPLAGKISTLSAIESGWRTRQPGDLVSTVDIVLPSPSRQQPELVPEVRFTLDPSSAGTGFLRFIFLDPDGKISGDVRVLKVTGTTIEPLSSGAKSSAPGTASVYGSLGFMDRANYIAYATSAAPRWSVEISESADYNAKEQDWTKLDTFELRNGSK